MDDIDLSHLLSPIDPPADGAARVRATVKSRKRRRRIVGGGLAAVLTIGVGVGVVSALSGPDDVLFQSPANHTTITDPTTTTGLPDPRLRYIGLEHNNRGLGLPAEASIKFGWPGDALSDPKPGDDVLYWVRDEVGDMVWMETITRFDPTSHATTSKVLAVFDVPPLTNSQLPCVGTCVRKSTNKEDPTWVAVFENGTLVRSWKADFSRLTLTITPTSDLLSHAAMTTTTVPVSTPPNPPRPALYEAVAMCNPTTCKWYTANEQVSRTGAAGPSVDFLVHIIRDNKDMKNVLVWASGLTIYDTLIVDMAEGQPMTTTGNYLYKGQAAPGLVLITTGGAVSKAWMMDLVTHTFVTIDAADVTLK